MRWQQIQEFVSEPPARPAAAPEGRPRSGPRTVIMTPEQEAAAFAAYTAATGE